MMSSMLLLAWSGKMMFVHLVVAQQAQIGSNIPFIEANLPLTRVEPVRNSAELGPRMT